MIYMYTAAHREHFNNWHSKLNSHNGKYRWQLSYNAAKKLQLVNIKLQSSFISHLSLSLFLACNADYVVPDINSNLHRGDSEPRRLLHSYMNLIFFGVY